VSGKKKDQRGDVGFISQGSAWGWRELLVRKRVSWGEGGDIETGERVITQQVKHLIDVYSVV
jgi:hypothetical protein